MKKYDIIDADPPWEYDDKALAGNRGACCKYPTMTIDEICALPVKNLRRDNCILFLWMTFPKMFECYPVFESWGFTYKTVAFVWIKTNKRTNPNQASFFPEDSFDDKIGMGGWTRANAEICLLGTHGKPKRVDAGVRQIIYEPTREHSRKPDCHRDRIIKLCGDLPRIELFARERITGWDAFGNQVEESIKL